MAVRYGRYEVMYKLGQGAMAQVYLARDPVLSRFVAVKVLHAELAARKDVLQRFFNEARTVAVIRNPHVVEVFDFGQEGKDLYLVMEFVDGLSLQGVLKQLRPQGASADREGFAGAHRETPLFFEPLDATVAAALMCQAAEGLSLAAQHGVVHRDVKPENLMINSQGYLKISDFGIAHVQDDSITKTGAVLGSPLYMSPEQARGLKPITSQADMFSLGAVFYCCLVGHPPFRGKSVTELFRKIAQEPHAPLWRLRPDLDPALGNLVETLLQKNPADRGGGPRWLHRQLKGYLMALGVADPAELIAGYLQELSARGVHTTWKDPTAGVAGTAVATERYTRESKRRVPAAAVTALWALGLGAALGGGWLAWKQSGLPGQPVAQGNAQVTASLGSGLVVPGSSAFASRAGSPVRGEGSPASAPGPGTGSIPGANARLTTASGASSGIVPAGSATASGSSPVGPAGSAAIAGSSPAASGPNSPASSSHPGDAGALARGPDSSAPSAIPGGESILLLKSSPPFAEAFVDGRYVGVTPVKVAMLQPGRHRVVLKSKQATALDTMLTLQAGTQGFKYRIEDGSPARVAETPDEP